ncbi:MAG TPA: hypothetical protein VE422_30895 [Terriglobia bacterium]|nr:hypothetical protein [Terriglobia bacterium]
MKPDPGTDASGQKQDAQPAPIAQPPRMEFEFPSWDEIQMRVYSLLKRMAWSMCIDYPQLESEDLAHETFTTSAPSYYHSPKRRARFQERDSRRKKSFNGWLHHTLSSAMRDARARLLDQRRPAKFIPMEEETEDGDLQDIAAVGNVLVSNYRTKFINDRLSEIIAQVFENHANASPDGQLSLECVAMHRVEGYSFPEIARHLAKSGEKRPWYKVRYLVKTDLGDLFKEFNAQGVTSLKGLWITKSSTKS